MFIVVTVGIHHEYIFVQKGTAFLGIVLSRVDKVEDSVHPFFLQ